MTRMIWTLLATVALLGMPQVASALVISGEIPPGDVQLGYGWDMETAFRQLIQLQPHVGGHFLDAPTWWDGHYTVEYFYQGNGDDLQQLTNALDKLGYPHCKIVIAEAEGFWDGNGLLPRKDSLPYNWSLRFSETRMTGITPYRNVGKQVINMPIVVLTVYDSEHLDLSSYRIPYRLLKNPRIPAAAVVTGNDAPADALHATVRVKLQQ